MTLRTSAATLLLAVLYLAGCRSASPANGANDADLATTQPAAPERPLPQSMLAGIGTAEAQGDMLATGGDLTRFSVGPRAKQDEMPAVGAMRTAPSTAAQAEPAAGDEREFLLALCSGARNARSVAAEEWSMAALHLFTIANYGGTTCAGTIRVDALRRAQSYEASPTDRLVVVSPKDVTEYRFTRIEGDTSSLRQFYNDQRAFEFEVFRQGAFHMRIATTKNQQSFKRRFLGAIAIGRGVAQFDLLEGGGGGLDHGESLMRVLDKQTGEIASDYVGIEHRAESSVNGRLEAAGGEVAVSEMFDGRIVNDVQQTKIAATSQGRRGDAAYQLREVYFQQVERDGWPIENDYWKARGDLTRDGQTIGRSTFHNDIRPNYRAMQLSDGTLIPM